MDASPNVLAEEVRMKPHAIGTLAFDHSAELLQETLDEERAADEELSWIARRFVNPQSIRSAGAS